MRFAADGLPARVRAVQDLGRRRVIEVEAAGARIKMVDTEGGAPPESPRIAFVPERTFVYVDGWLARRKGVVSGRVSHPRAWLLVAPVLFVVAFNAVAPLMTVVNYSVQETFGDNVFFWHGVEWFRQVLRSERFHDAFLRQAAFSAAALLIELPLGVAVALAMPRRGAAAAACLVLIALPLLIPWNVVELDVEHFRPARNRLDGARHQRNRNRNTTSRAIRGRRGSPVLLMDVWHWTSLVALLAYAGLRAIPPQYYQAAKIDGASRLAILRRIELPKLRRVLTIAALLRFMDSFHDLHRAVRFDRRRPRQLDDFSFDRSRQNRAGAI